VNQYSDPILIDKNLVGRLQLASFKVIKKKFFIFPGGAFRYVEQ
jgi:hypothetical protein